MIGIRILAAFHLRKLTGGFDALTIAFALSMPLTLLIAVATIGFTTNNISLLTYYKLILASLFEVILAMGALKGMALYREKMKQKEWRQEKLSLP
jgi:hypothetical protein